jgi:hypothetical protein
MPGMPADGHLYPWANEGTHTCLGFTGPSLVCDGQSPTIHNIIRVDHKTLEYGVFAQCNTNDQIGFIEHGI